MKTLPRLLLLALSSRLAAPALPVFAGSVAVAFAPPARSVPLGSTFVDWATLSFRPSPVGLYCSIFDDPTRSLEKLEIHVTTLRPGMASHSPHHHPWEEMLLIKAGRVEVSINGATFPAGPGALVFLASNDAHNLTNVGTTPATYYVFNFCTSAVHTVGDKPAAEWAPPQMLTSRVVDCDHFPGPPTKEGEHRELFDSPTLTFLRLESHITRLGAGQSSTPRNRDPGEELFLVKSGVVEATLNGVTCRLSEGSFFYVAPNDERTMRAAGDAPCSYQVIKVVSERTPPQA
jgi:quercetin dioxygenase-like cupin family protein